RVEHRADAPLEPADARLAVDAEVQAAVEADARILDSIDRDAVALEIEAELAQRRARGGPHEEALARVERLVELGADALHAADLRRDEPVGAEGVEPGALVERAQLVLRLRAEIGGEVEAEAQIVRAPRFFH